MLAARADIETRKNAWKSDIDEYIEKPFNTEELLIRCQNLLNIRQILSQRLQSELKDFEPSSISSLNQKNQKFLQRIKGHVEKNFSDTSLNAKSLCKTLGMSESQLQRKTKALVDQSIPEYIRNFRLKKGAEYLKEGQLFSDVAYNVGFSNPTYFSSCFKAHYGMTAREYMKSSQPNN